MFKTNLSPLNPIKNNFPNANDFPNTSNQYNHQPSFQYKAMYPNNNNPTHYKQDLAPSTNYNPPLTPLSPNICKNSMSPTAKIKMFSNTLNKKPSQTTNGLQVNTQEPQQKQQKTLNKMGVKNLTLNLNESIDLKCDQVLEQTLPQYRKQQPHPNQYRKQTPQQPISQNPYTKRTISKIPELNLQTHIDDLKCDQVLQIRNDAHDDSKRNPRINNNNGNVYMNAPLSNNDLENNFTYTNVPHKQFPFQNTSDKPTAQPLTPGYDRKKSNPLILMRKNTDHQPQSNNTSNPLFHQQQKPRSFTHVVSPHLLPKYNQNNEEEHDSPRNQSHSSIEQLNYQKRYEEMLKLVERTQSVIEAYQRQADQAKQQLSQTKDKLSEVQERNSFLEKENMQLRKCVYEEGSGSGRNLPYNYPLTPGANRYQGIK